MPRKKPRQFSPVRTARKVKTRPPTPFSVVLTLEEMAILRREAARQKTSMGGVVRCAIHAVLFRAQPDLVRQMVNREVESFLALLRTRYPGAEFTPVLACSDSAADRFGASEEVAAFGPTYCCQRVS